MRLIPFYLCAAVLVLSFQVRGQTPPREAPPNEPPYTKDTEFDSLMNEDPSASQQRAPPSVPTSEPIQTQKAPSPEAKPSQAMETSPAAEQTAPAPRNKVLKGVHMVHHPEAAHGLIRIEEDGTYVYKVKTSPKDQTGVMRFGMMTPPQITAQGGLTNFADMYGSGGLFTVLADYEWHPFSGSLGKLGVQAGFGLATAQGHGAFIDGNNTPPPMEKYTFFAVPLNLGIVYRLEFMRRQWVAPYVSGGGSYIPVAELRDDGKKNFTGTPAGYAAGGAMINITALDKDVAFIMDSEYGIGTLWMVAEYRYIQALSSDLGFTGSLISLGFAADF